MPFAEFLDGIDRGRVSDEAAAKLAELVEAVTDTGRKGTLTLSIVVEPWKGSDANVEVTASASLKKPAPNHGGVFFVGPRYQLSRDDPSMDPMFERGEAGGSH